MFMSDITLFAFFMIGIIFLASSVIKGITGFGTALFALPLITAFFLTPELARPLVVGVNLCLNIFILYKEKSISKQNYFNYQPLIISGFIASILSVFLLPRINIQSFTIILGVLMVLTALNKLFEGHHTINNHQRYYILVGILGGILNTLIGAGGVIVLIFLSNTRVIKKEFRLTLLIYFFIINTGSMIAFLFNQSLHLETIGSIFLVLPFAILGSLLGILMNRNINERIFTKIVSLLLIIMGLNNIFQIF